MSDALKLLNKKKNTVPAQPNVVEELKVELSHMYLHLIAAYLVVLKLKVKNVIPTIVALQCVQPLPMALVPHRVETAGKV